MTVTPADGRRCEECRDDLAALALGTLGGRDRAAVVSHLEHCGTCAAELDRLAAAGDELVVLLPPATPPDGFAERTLSRLHTESQATGRAPTAPRRWRVVVAVAAAVVVLALGVGFGALAANGGGSGPTTSSSAASLVSATGAHGSAVVSPATGGLLFVTLADGLAASRVTCAVTLADGTHHVVGRYTLYGGYGTWAVPLPADRSPVRSLVLTDAAGNTVATADFPA